ncbi:orcokinin peptides type B-like [Dreissena polymorpha]|uniref:Uncharacterized protein n=1 Tax=Dreissena polymorpha TaxID=45954 RepID=A0A9D4H2H1_DREPO|nr:orcokinin peptides type B-like [Dreissena polymorpha]KAH3827365.1 hypothetical protein DPMN_129301 [Dreissena polymorpha]
MLDKLAAGVFLLCLHTSLATDSVALTSDTDAHDVDKRPFDSIAAYRGFKGFADKRPFDSIYGGRLRGFIKRHLDSINGYHGFSGFNKRPMDSINRGGFSGFVKRPMDSINRGGFSGFVKRPMDSINRGGFSGFVKRRFDSIGSKGGFRGFIKRDESGESEQDFQDEFIE